VSAAVKAAKKGAKSDDVRASRAGGVPVSPAHWTDVLVAIRACQLAVEWARTQPDYATAWEACPDPEWLVWLVDRLDPDPRHIDLWLATCLIAERALRFVPSGEDRPRAAIECRRAWCRGEAADSDLAAAGAAARAAAEAAAWAAVWAAVWAAAGAAAWAAARAAAEAAAGAAARAAAEAAARAAAEAAAWDAAWDAERAEQCRIIRTTCARPALEVCP
jgi:hypothetical protein